MRLFMKKIRSVLIFLLCILVCIGALSVIKKHINIPTLEELSFIFETEPPQELTDIGSPYKHYYNQLSDDEKSAYNAILSEIYSMPESIRIPRVDAAQLDAVFSALLYDNPDLFFVGRRCTLITEAFSSSCSIEYTVDKDEYEACRAELEKVCNDVISSLSNPDDEWQTELEIHDYVVENCEYKIVEDELVYSSAYGALVNGEAACEGYSKAAKLLLDKAGIENAVLSGISIGEDSNGGAHMWNAVKIYGDYYYLDCTWDDPLSEDGDSMKIYSYFNLNNEMISATHSDFSYDFNCTATAANYYIKTGKFFETYDRADEKALAALIARELDAGSEVIEIRFGSKSVYKSAVKDLIDGGRIYNVLSQAKKQTGVNISSNSVTYYRDEGLLTLTIIPKRN